jgi:uncharacterized membrane protein YagU involved in acid resistance
MKNSYIFPNILAEVMSKVDMRTQLEASMMSMALMMVGLILSIIYAFIYIDLALWYKIVLVINAIAGLIFMSSFLVTTYQQYLNYMEAYEFQQSVKGGEENNA